MSRLKTYLLTIITLLFLHPLFSENFRYTGSKNYIYVERTDLRRYDNGKYAGLMSREVKAYITPTASAKSFIDEFAKKYNLSYSDKEKLIKSFKAKGAKV